MIHSFVNKDKFELEGIKIDRIMGRDVKWHMHISREIYQKSNGMHQLPTKPSKLPTLYPPPLPLSHPHRFRIFISRQLFNPKSEISRPISSYKRLVWYPRLFGLVLYIFALDFQPLTLHFLMWKRLIYRGLPPMKSDHLRTSPGMPSARGSFSLMHRAKSSAVY
jgi:hypothetical protein